MHLPRLLPKSLRPLPVALALALLGPGAHAQSLLEMYEAARAYDATYLAARALAESAQYRAAQAEALARPTASAGLSATESYTWAPQSAANPRGDDYAASFLGGTLQGRLPLYNRANSVAIDQARRSLEAASSDLQAAEQDLVVRVAQAYFEVLAAQDALGLTRASKAFITEQLASAKRNFEVGTATITDTREAQARFDLASAQEIAAENNLNNRRIALAYLVGRRGLEPRGLATPVVLPPAEPADIETWVRNAEEAHPAVRKARVGLEVAQLETEKARAGERPTFDAIANVAHSQGGRTLSNLDPTTTTSVGVQMNWPLYTGGATQSRIQETLKLEEKSRNDVEAARRGVGQATRQAYLGVLSGQAQVKALEAAEASSKLALESTELGYKVGVRVNIDVLNAQTQLVQTRFDLAKARYDVIVGGLRLRQAAGTLTPEDVRAVNALLQR
jgi:outer membrane protein